VLRLKSEVDGKSDLNPTTTRVATSATHSKTKDKSRRGEARRGKARQSKAAGKGKEMQRTTARSRAVRMQKRRGQARGSSTNGSAHLGMQRLRWLAGWLAGWLSVVDKMNDGRRTTRHV
jgi:hypothetical protein